MSQPQEGIIYTFDREIPQERLKKSTTLKCYEKLTAGQGILTFQLTYLIVFLPFLRDKQMM